MYVFLYYHVSHLTQLLLVTVFCIFGTEGH